MPAERKRNIRVSARAARAALTPERRAEASAAICRALFALPELAGVRAVLGYVATAEEADPAEAIAALRARGVRIALPRVSAPASLTLHWVRTDDELAPGAFGILEPSADSPTADPADIDVAIVPGVAFDAACNRVGYGGFFYDVLLPTLRADTPRIGLAFGEQVVAEVPAEEHDAPLDVVVTPEGVHRRAR